MQQILRKNQGGIGTHLSQTLGEDPVFEIKQDAREAKVSTLCYFVAIGRTRQGLLALQVYRSYARYLY